MAAADRAEGGQVEPVLGILVFHSYALLGAGYVK